MKKLILILPILILAACDRPTLDTHIIAWAQDTQTYVPFHVKLYNDHATVSAYGKTNHWEKSVSYRTIDTATECYHGILPIKSAPGAEMCFRIYINKNLIEALHLAYDGDTYLVSLAAPFKSTYKHSTEEEICINKIEQMVQINGLPNEKFFGLRIITSFQLPDNCESFQYRAIDIPANDAIKISDNWDYSNPKFYHNEPDWILEEHEKDACETLKRLNKYISENNIEIRQLNDACLNK